MSRPANSDSAQPSASEDRNGRQDTVLLSEVPAAVVDAADASPSLSSPNPAADTDPRLDLSSTSLAALGQRYDVLSAAGHGSMGNVYKARDRETGEIVALKILKPEIASDQGMVERFKNELLFARKITHKNVCRVHEFNRVGPIAYTSMEFVEGESLRSVLNRFGGLPIRKAIHVAQQICSGLREAHAQGIVHRDLKPENVMIDAQGNVKIMDFGIARSMEAATRLTGSMVGTPAYMAPEQVSGKQVDYRTDIYSLGLMLYEMFTGAQAFQAETPVAAALKQIREMPPLPHEIDPTIPVAIERAILRCLEKDPAKRFQSVEELERALAMPGPTTTPPGAAAGIAPELSALASSGPDLRTTAVRIDRPFASLGPAPKERRRSGLVWVLLTLLLLGGAGAAAARWTPASKWIATRLEAFGPPAPLPAPKPPDYAFVIPANEGSSTDGATPGTEPTAAASTSAVANTGPGSANPAKNTEAGSQPSSPQPALASGSGAAKPSASKREVFPRVELPGKKKSARQIELESDSVPQDVQRRADKAFGVNKSLNSTSEVEATYLFVGRYQREVKANEVVQKISGLSLPVMAIPRHGPKGPFWVVITGPFTAKRAPDVMQWLEAQGYHGVHDFQFPFGNGNPKPNAH
jgi:serine/threonine protein kinase